MLLLFLGSFVNAQQITCSPKDKPLFESKMAALEKTMLLVWAIPSQPWENLFWVLLTLKKP